MAEKDDIDVKIDEMLQILQENDQENGCEPTMRLLHKDGTLNEEARVKLVSNLNDVKEDREHRKKTKTSEKQSRWSITKPDCVGPYTEGWGFIGKKRKVNVYMPFQTPATKSIEADMGKLFEKMSVGCKFLHILTELLNDAPLIVVCPVSSRLEPDVDHVLQGLKWPTRFAVIVLNMTRENSLPRLPIGTRLNTKQEKYKNIEFIDAAFTPEQHMYNCNMNIEARNKISAYIDIMYKK